MAKAKAKKRQDVENELVKHADLIADPKVKQYILKKKEEKRQKELQKYQKSHGAMGKDVDMLMEDSEEESEIEEIKAVETVKAKKSAKTKAIGKK